MANPFSVNVLGGLDIGKEMRTSKLFADQQREQERLADQRNKMQEAMRGAVSGDADAIETLFTLNPQMALKMEQRNQERFASQGAAADKVKTEAELDWATQYRQALINDDQEAQQGLIDEAESNPLIEFDQTMIGKDPQQDNLVVNTMLYRGLGKDAYKALVSGKGGGGAKIGAASPKDFTSESLAEYERSGNIADLNRYSPKTVKVAGVEHQLNPETQKWEPVVDVTSKDLSVQAAALAVKVASVNVSTVAVGR